jgi:hypothetical protein
VCVCVYNERFALTYIRLVLSTKVSIGTIGTTLLFAPNSSLGEQIRGACMPSWVLLSMIAVEERVRKEQQNYKQELN